MRGLGEDRDRIAQAACRRRARHKRYAPLPGRTGPSPSGLLASRGTQALGRSLCTNVAATAGDSDKHQDNKRQSTAAVAYRRAAGANHAGGRYRDGQIAWAPAASRLAAADASSYSPPPYGADIGNAYSLKALQMRWIDLHVAHPQLFDGLQSLVSLRKPTNQPRRAASRGRAVFERRCGAIVQRLGRLLRVLPADDVRRMPPRAAMSGGL
jgi:hypothetical protein